MVVVATYVSGCLIWLCNHVLISVCVCVCVYVVVLYAIPSHNTHVLLVATVCVIIGLHTHFWLQTCLPRITHILLSWTVSVAFANRKQFVRVNRMPYITHTLIWLTIYVAHPNSKQFIEANCMPYIANTLIWLPVSIVLPHRKQFEWVNCVPCITHATKIWTVFDASSIANVLHLFWQFLHHRLRLLHRTHFHRRVSDRSVAFGPSCSSDMKALNITQPRMGNINKSHM